VNHAERDPFAEAFARLLFAEREREIRNTLALANRLLNDPNYTKPLKSGDVVFVNQRVSR
jgi:hypothetical protein